MEEDIRIFKATAYAVPKVGQGLPCSCTDIESGEKSLIVTGLLKQVDLLSRDNWYSAFDASAIYLITVKEIQR